MAIMLLCPECMSDALIPHITERQATEKFKCLQCKKISLITRVEYTTVRGEDYELEQKYDKREEKKINKKLEETRELRKDETKS